MPKSYRIFYPRRVSDLLRAITGGGSWHRRGSRKGRRSNWGRPDVLSGLRLLGCRERLSVINDSMRILRRILLSEIARGLRGLLRVSG